MPKDIALLAPVPLEHLQAGEGIASAAGFVAFGSMKWELFRKLDDLRHGQRIPAFIYPSHESDPTKVAFVIRWFGWYVGHVDSAGGAHPAGMAHRPPSTASYATDNKGHWAAFWHVAGLQELPKPRQVPISDFQTHPSGTWRKNAPPRGPEIVAAPAWFDEKAFT